MIRSPLHPPWGLAPSSPDDPGPPQRPLHSPECAPAPALPAPPTGWCPLSALPPVLPPMTFSCRCLGPLTFGIRASRLAWVGRGPPCGVLASLQIARTCVILSPLLRVPPTRRLGRGSLQAAGPFLPLLLLLTPCSAHPHPPGWTPPRGTCQVGCVHGGRSSPLPPSEEGLRGNGNEESMSHRGRYRR